MTNGAYRQWRGQPFPASGIDDDLDELHADLAYWDSVGADTIVPVMERGVPYDSGVVDLKRGLAEYRERVAAACQQATPADAALIAQYLAYADLLIAANAEASGAG